MVDPQAASEKRGATAADLLRRPDLTAEQRERLLRAMAAATPPASPAACEAPPKLAPPSISAHLLARVRQKEMADQLFGGEADAATRQAGQDHRRRFLNALHSMLVRRLGRVAPAVTLKRAELVAQLYGPIPLPPLQVCALTGVFLCTRKLANLTSLQLGLTEPVIHKYLDAVVKACIAMHVDWFVFQAPDQYTFRGTFDIAAVARHLDAADAVGPTAART